MWGWLLQIKRLDTDTIGVDDGIGNYDYDNANDRENFCPDLGVSGVWTVGRVTSIHAHIYIYITIIRILSNSSDFFFWLWKELFQFTASLSWVLFAMIECIEWQAPRTENVRFFCFFNPQNSFYPYIGCTEFLILYWGKLRCPFPRLESLWGNGIFSHGLEKWEFHDNGQEIIWRRGEMLKGRNKLYM